MSDLDSFSLYVEPNDVLEDDPLRTLDVGVGSTNDDQLSYLGIGNQSSTGRVEGYASVLLNAAELRTVIAALTSALEVIERY